MYQVVKDQVQVPTTKYGTASLVKTFRYRIYMTSGSKQRY